MPKKTKEQTNEIEKQKKSTKKPTSKATSKKATTKSTATKTTKTATSKAKTTSRKAVVAKDTASTAKTTTSTKKATSSAKKVATKSTKTAKKKSTNKRTVKKKVEIVEYYDLPYRYNQTVVKVLAQTPTNLFIYWDISDKDRKEFEKKYGENFFEITKPVLIVHNDTLGYSFEVEINDFANSWYLHVADSKCDYRIELGRKPFEKTKKINKDYIYISASNEIKSPNDRILFDHNQKQVYYRNVKTGEQTSKEIFSMSFMKNMGKFYNIYDLYKALYQEENIEKIYDLSNPSSGNPSSSFI